jgi:hypothetical protein
MYNITLVCTRHSELGKCNSGELYKIFEAINPEIIFEEIPPNCFDQYYISKERSNLETNTINRFVQTHDVKHIPVDSDDMPPESFFKNYERLLKRIENLTNVHGFNYRKSVDTNREYIAVHGFKYLNSNNCSIMNDVIVEAVEKGLLGINNSELFQILNVWKEINEVREAVILQNIYKYSEEHSYDNAIVTIGYAHRKSIMQKIQVLETEQKLKLNWGLYDPS